MILPVVYRELWEAARRKATYRARIVASTILLIVCGSILVLSLDHVRQSESGLMVFCAATFLNLFVCLGNGSLASDSISREKRDGTLGLLFLTDLTARDIVLGKMSASLIPAFYSLLATVPIAALPLMMGGVTSSQFCRVVLVWFNALFFSVSGAMLASALCRTAQKAAFITALLVLGPALFAPVMALGLRLYFQEKFGVSLGWESLAPFLAVSPFTAVTAVVAPMLPAPIPIARWLPMAYWVSLGATHVLTWVYLVSAIVVARKSWQDRPTRAGRPSWRERFEQFCRGRAIPRLNFRRRLLSINPVFWLASRDRFQPYYVWMFLGVTGLLTYLGPWKHGGFDDDGSWLVPVIFIHLVLKVWIASVAGDRLAEDSRTGALELILATSLRTPEILRGHWLAFRRQFLLPAILVGLFDVSILLVARLPEISVAVMVSLIVFVADMLTLARVGLWMSASKKTPQIAKGQTVFLTLCVPWMAHLATMAFVALWIWFFDVDFEPGAYLNLALWTVYSLTADFMVWRWSGRCLRSRLREACWQRFDAELDPGWWQRFWRMILPFS